ncbi:MAG TPA: glycosyltransferase family 2 protein [Polyangiaceae bacterium]|nr:glycosyltransferase family 2 protein [Polyangiaceae bacterium]
MSPRVVAVVPAFDAEASVSEVVRGLVQVFPPDGAPRVLVVDDGSTDGTSRAAEEAGALVVRHPQNRGKGAALRTGFERAARMSARMAVTVDADGQHRAEDARRLAEHDAPPEALVLGVRDLVRDGAPKPNRFSNGISNFFLSRFSGLPLADTQCGLRRYPLPRALALGGSANGYAYEAEMVLLAARAKIPIVEVPVRAFYPPEHLRVTHFDSVKDPARIVFHVVRTVLAPPPRP